MRVFIAGATGVLGRRIVAIHVSRGDEVVATSRSDANDQVLRHAGAKPARVDLVDAPALTRAAKGAKVVIRASTAIPAFKRFKRKDWVANDRVRVEGTRALLQAARDVGARSYVQESIVWVASPGNDTLFDESAKIRSRLWFDSAAQAEALAQEAADKDFATASVRFGAFYASD